MPPRRQPSTRTAAVTAANTTKRTTTTAHASTRKASTSRTTTADSKDEPNELAERLQNKLTISNPKAKMPVPRRTAKAAPIMEAEEEPVPLPVHSSTEHGRKTPIRQVAARQPRAPTKSRTREGSQSLADELETKLTIADSKTRHATSSRIPKEPSLDAMRTVNAASKGLSGLVDCGWNASCGHEAPAIARKGSGTTTAGLTMTSAMEYFRQAKKGLQALRELKPRDVDVERAAASLAAKLISLEMYDCALDVLRDMYTPLVLLYHRQDLPFTAFAQAELLSLPFPPTPRDCSDTILTLLSAYLLHILTVVAYTTAKDTSTAGRTDLADFCNALYSTNTLIQWLPYLNPLPMKHLDSILTRAYTAVAKSSQLRFNSEGDARILYRIRIYGLLCLAHTTSGVLQPSTFWNQAAKFTISYVKGAHSSSEPPDATSQDLGSNIHVTETVSNTFTELVECARQREDKAVFMSGRGFITFCEYWTSFAKRASDVHTLERIRKLMLSNELDSASPSGSTVPNTPAETVPVREGRNRTASRHHATFGHAVESAQLYTLLSEATALLEQPNAGTEGTPCLNEALDAMERCDRYLQVSYEIVPERNGEEGDERRGADRVKRSFERLRRAAVRALEASSPARSASQDSSRRQLVKAILTKSVHVLEAVVRTTPHHDLLTAGLDSLFVLARTSLVISNPSTFEDAYSYLTRSSALVPKESKGVDVLAHANFVRCISGAFHNLAATLYQATRFDFAVRFLDQSCVLGESALGMYRQTGLDGEGVVAENSDESWAQLEDQIWRRWEILGVCHSKTEDRKRAFKSFINCVKTFPFHQYGFVELASKSSATSLFDSPQFRHIGGIIDRLTYGGLCDLYQEPRAVSLRTHLKDSLLGLPDEEREQGRCTIIGAALERQIESLEGSKWKPNVRKAIEFFLAELLEVYDVARMPIRRARVLLKSLEIAYHGYDGLESSSFDKFYIGDIATEADKLLTTEATHWDGPLSRFQPYYRATLKLRLVLLVHRSAQTSLFSRVVAYSDEACNILKTLTSPELRPPTVKSSPPHTRGGRKTAAKTQGSRPAAGRIRARTVRNTAAVVPVTPKRKSSKSVHTTAVTPPSNPDHERSSDASDFDGVSQLVDLLRATAQLLGLLGQVITKVSLLLQARRICEQMVQSRPDDFVKISVDLAHEYVKLGKTGKGANVYMHTLSVVKNLPLSEETRMLYFLRYSESLAVTGNVLKSSTAYCEACSLSDSLSDGERGISTTQRITARSACLERGAIAASTFANIQYSRDEPATSINGLLQSLRLWNRALDNLARLVPPKPTTKVADDDNPFLVEKAKGAQTDGHHAAPTPTKTFQRPPALNGLEWRIAEGLLGTLFSLVQAYLSRGSPREAEYFANQAKDLAESLDAPAMASRALALAGEIQLHLGSLEESHASLMKAAELAANTSGPNAVEIRRLLAEYSRRNADDKEAQQLYAEAISTLEELEALFGTLDGANAGARKSLGTSSQVLYETMAPEVLVAILRQNIWLLHGEGEEYQSLLERFRAIPASGETKAEQDALLGKLTLDSVYSRFQADMFLNSLTESTITLPMGKTQESTPPSASRQEILGVLASAEKLFWSDLSLVARRGRVFHVRDAAISLALIRAFQVSLGKTTSEAPLLAARLLDAASSITLRREILEVVQHKFPEVDHDDLQWPLITSNGSPLSPQKSRNRLRFNTPDSDGDEDVFEEKTMKEYWDYIKKKYESYVCDATHFSETQSSKLPPNWTVISISVTEDRNTLFISRQRPRQDPLIVCIPLKGRRENDDDEQLTFDGALTELKEIIQLSDEGTRQASNVRNDREGRAAWWATRSALDKRLKELLDNIEFCWLGAFKAILSEPTTVPADLLADFRTSLEQVFERSIVLRDKRQKTTVSLDDSLVECFASLSPKCRDEELEDVVYFILDLYQFHGVPVASAEIDIDQAVVDVRAALEEFSAKSQDRLVPEKDPHMFLVLDKNVQGIPWESIPVLRGRSVSRIPSMDFLLDRLEYAKFQKASTDPDSYVDRIAVDPRKVFYALNPSGDLKNTEGRFVEWLKTMKTLGWEGVIGRPPSEQQFIDALVSKDLVLYFGHGGAEQYIRSRKVRHLPRCAATMLWGCSSGALKEMGDFDRTGTPHNYMLAGCPTLVANLWDVTDRDIDKFAQSVFDKIALNAEQVRDWKGRETTGRTSVVTALGQSRDSCKLKYLTGAAPVIYGIPFYL